MTACIMPPAANAFVITSNRMAANVRPSRLRSDNQRLLMAANDDFLKDIDGKVVRRPSDDFELEVGHGALKYFAGGTDAAAVATREYVKAIYGYGTSSFPERNTPQL
jgi:hypothetical protein